MSELTLLLHLYGLLAWTETPLLFCTFKNPRLVLPSGIQHSGLVHEILY